ncbi:hypothetical protein [Celeribacter sp.]|uniref:hypothetical protein n=1 Tax=Celeribacter sp. TaxID=1890673 RepID=UPI003A91F3E0
MFDGTRDWILPPAPDTPDDAPAREEQEAVGPWFAVSAPWVRRPDAEEIAEDVARAGWTTDNPHGLRKRSEKYPEAAASALVRMAEASLTSEDKEVREVAYLTVEYFQDRHWRWTTLEVFLNIRRAGGGLSRKEPVVSRNACIRELASMSPWCSMSPPAAADDMLSKFRRYESTGWPREQDKVEPPKPQDRVRTLFWLIAQTGAPGPLPNRQDLATHIEAFRK